jgi:hypothetical protein
MKFPGLEEGFWMQYPCFPNGAAEIPHLSVGRKEYWEVNFTNASDRICSEYTANRCSKYTANRIPHL